MKMMVLSEEEEYLQEKFMRFSQCLICCIQSPNIDYIIA